MQNEKNMFFKIKINKRKPGILSQKCVTRIKLFALCVIGVIYKNTQLETLHGVYILFNLDRIL